MASRRFLFLAGGTGGHIFPALATAQLLQVQQEKVFWMGGTQSMEQRLISATDIPFFGITVRGIRGKGFLQQLMAPLQILQAIWTAIKVIRQIKPDCVIGMGGYASGPGSIAALLLRKPLVIHEQNAVAGLTNRILAKTSAIVLAGFPDAFEGSRPVKIVGNPLRQQITEIYYKPKLPTIQDRPVNLLILGGSLGAAKLNECVPAALGNIELSQRPKVWHQAGDKKLTSTQEHYRNASVRAHVTDFIDDMAEAYRWADLVICRAGALTVSELCVAGRGAILVPLPHAVDDHQTLNARYMEKSGAAWILPQSKLNPETLAEVLEPLLKKPERIKLLAEAARSIAQPEATEKVADECRRACYA